MTLPSWEFSS